MFYLVDFVLCVFFCFFFFQAEDGIRDVAVTGVQTCALPILNEPPEEPLTPREIEIVRHVAMGLRNAEVAERLSISEVTVKTHLNNIFQKLGVRGRTALAVYAIRMGLVGVQ